MQLYCRSSHYLGLILILMFGFFTKVAHADIEVGKPAPEFELYDQQQRKHHLKDYVGKWLVLYFYPKDDTPGCTIEACAFRDDYHRIRALDAEILGVSLDSIESHAQFATGQRLPFPLLSDPEGAVAAAYGSLLALGPVKLARRHTIIIDQRGHIARIYRRVDPKRHSAQIIVDLQELQSKSNQRNN